MQIGVLLAKSWIKTFFANPALQSQFQKYKLLRLDMTGNTVQDQQIMAYFNVIAHQTILVFYSHGQEISQHRVIGEVSADEFKTRLK